MGEMIDKIEEGQMVGAGLVGLSEDPILFSERWENIGRFEQV